MEDFYLGTPPSGFFSAAQAHRARDRGLSHAGAGIFHNLVFVSIDKQYPGQAYKVMNALWGRA
jgi:4-hydroxy-3-polyprenylbenzoate decarboxylase